MSARSVRVLLLAIGMAGAASVRAEPVATAGTFTCPVTPGPGVALMRARNVLGGGMAGDGWDGEGNNATLMFWHMENVTGDMAASEQRQAYIAAMQTWANLVQITFEEIPVANQIRSVDWAYAVGDHCALESAECGDSDCTFGATPLGHAGFPPGVASTCGGTVSETWAGNVHFNDMFPFSRDAGTPGTWSLQALAVHELGHAIGLTHDLAGGGPHIMAPTLAQNTPAYPPSTSDVLNVQSGYAPGLGGVVTLETLGVWVQSGYSGQQLGSFFSPFATVAQGIAGVPPGSTQVALNVRAGSYPGAITITQPMFLRAPTGLASIGGP